MIAGIEKTHGDRFGKFAELLEQDKLFVSDVQVKWMCLNCGQIIDAPWLPPCAPSASIHRATLSAGRWRPSNNCKPHTQALTARRRRWVGMSMKK